MQVKDLYSHLRVLPDYPEEGHNFYDITAILENNEAFKLTIEELAKPYEGEIIDKVVSIDSRGLMLAAPLAFYLGCGLSIIRTDGKSPYKNINQVHEIETDSKSLELHIKAIHEGEKIVIVDDVLATGNTMRATIDLVHKAKAEIVGISFLIELSYKNGKENISHFPIYSVLTFDE
ncbi:adenine phosphoribosyltransferase [Candidatus Falkowbacteria bacterium]|nr:adenine phosphoribosyltransferase [Candidatus Falkowbacteria bacterium]